MPTNFVTENRIGRFDIDYGVIEDSPQEVVAVLCDMIIIEASHNIRTRTIEYLAYCPRFGVVGPATSIPWYGVTVTRNINTTISFERSGRVVSDDSKTHRRQIRSL